MGASLLAVAKSIYYNNGKAGYNVGDKLDNNPGDNIPEIRQLPMVIITRTSNSQRLRSAGDND